jgi:hypothetical protein
MTNQNELNLFYLLVLAVGMLILGLILGVPLGWTARGYLLNHGELFRTINRTPVQQQSFKRQNQTVLDTSRGV